MAERRKLLELQLSGNIPKLPIVVKPIIKSGPDAKKFPQKTWEIANFLRGEGDWTVNGLLRSTMRLSLQEWMNRLQLPSDGEAMSLDLKDCGEYVENLDGLLKNSSKQKSAEDEVSIKVLKNLFFMVDDDTQWKRLVKNYQDLKK